MYILKYSRKHFHNDNLFSLYFCGWLACTKKTKVKRYFRIIAGGQFYWDTIGIINFVVGKGTTKQNYIFYFLLYLRIFMVVVVAQVAQAMAKKHQVYGAICDPPPLTYYMRKKIGW